MADNVTIDTGTSPDTTVRTREVVGVGHDQYVREARAITEGDDFWTIDTTGVSNRIAFNDQRVSVIMSNRGNGLVYLRFDATIPAANGSDAHLVIDVGSVLFVPLALTELNISVRGAVAGGTLATHLGVA